MDLLISELTLSYSRTKFSCEFVPKFSLDIETRYAGDSGTQVNILI